MTRNADIASRFETTKGVFPLLSFVTHFVLAVLHKTTDYSCHCITKTFRWKLTKSQGAWHLIRCLESSTQTFEMSGFCFKEHHDVYHYEKILRGNFCAWKVPVFTQKLLVSYTSCFAHQTLALLWAKYRYCIKTWLNCLLRDTSQGCLSITGSSASYCLRCECLSNQACLFFCWIFSDYFKDRIVCSWSWTPLCCGINIQSSLDSLVPEI